MSTTNPIELFEQWLDEARATAGLSHPATFCLSTIDERGFPDARQVDLKEVGDAGFLFGTRLDSPKARAIARNPRVAMTFWWDRLGRQVRVVGTARRADSEKADEVFRNRSHEARVVAVVSVQSEAVADLTELKVLFEEALKGPSPVRPECWGAFWVWPERVEFLRFVESRLHERRVFVRGGVDGWEVGWLCP